jgi:hypothetical protein
MQMIPEWKIKNMIRIEPILRHNLFKANSVPKSCVSEQYRETVHENEPLPECGKRAETPSFHQ